MAWAQNLLGFCFFARASQTPFSWVWPGGLQAFSLFLFILVGSKSNVSAVFWLRFRMVWALYFFLFNGFQKRRFGIFPAAVSQWLGHKTCWGSAFSHARPKHLFLEFGLVACRLPSLTLRKGLPCLRQPFFFVFSRFQKQRFGIFLFSAFFVGSKSNVSAVFWLRFRMVWQIFIILSFFLMGSNSDVSAFFRLRFRNGLGTKPAGVLPFRMRVPNTFFLSLAWWLAGFQVLRCAKVCLAVSYGLGTICDCGRAVGYLTMAPLHGTSFAVCACRNRFAKGIGRMLFLKAACMQRLPKLCFLWVPTVFLVGSRSNVSRFFGLQFRNGLGTKPAEVRFQVFLCAKVILAGSQLFLFFVGLSLQNSRASLAFTLRAIAWSGMLFRSVFCAWSGCVPERMKIGPRRRT